MRRAVSVDGGILRALGSARLSAKQPMAALGRAKSTPQSTQRLTCPRSAAFARKSKSLPQFAKLKTISADRLTQCCPSWQAATLSASPSRRACCALRIKPGAGPLALRVRNFGAIVQRRAREGHRRSKQWVATETISDHFKGAARIDKRGGARAPLDSCDSRQHRRSGCTNHTGPVVFHLLFASTAFYLLFQRPVQSRRTSHSCHRCPTAPHGTRQPTVPADARTMAFLLQPVRPTPAGRVTAERKALAG